jgi:uncharacterized protein with PQ loop repeat
MKEYLEVCKPERKQDRTKLKQILPLSAQWDYASLFFIGLAFLMGWYVRMWPVLSSDFPLNDGGLFYVMIQDLQRSHYALPEFTAFNSLHIPFVYPPLAFYLTAALSDLAGWSVLDLLRILPAMISTFTVLAFYPLALNVLRSRAQAAIAVFAFAMLPRAFEWMIMGGGLTRSISLLFALLAMKNAHDLYREDSKKYILYTVLFASLTLLSHPETAWFLAFTICLFFLFNRRDFGGLKVSALVLSGTILLVSPWLITLVARYGMAPVLAGFASGQRNWLTLGPLLSLDLTAETFLDLMGVIGILGIFVSLAERRLLLPTWLLAIYFVAPRTAGVFAIVPFAMLVGKGLEGIVLEGFNEMARSISSKINASTPIAWEQRLLRSRSAKLVLGFFVIYTFSYTVAYPYVGTATLHPVSKEVRKAMSWVTSNTPEDSRFIVITSMADVWRDKVSEWFPALADRPSIATVQGYEWIPGQFFLQWSRYLALQDCARQSAECIEAWAKDFDMPFSHIFLAKGDDLETVLATKILSQSLLSSTNYEMIYESPEVAIFELRDVPASSENSRLIFGEQ